jgi:hypothetical protein
MSASTDDSRKTGGEIFTSRLVVAIRDGVLSTINDPDGVAALTGVPKQELGPIADLQDDQRAALAKVVAWSVDIGIAHLLSGLDDEPDGLELRYNGVCVNDGSCHLPDSNVAPSDWSRFDRDGAPKPKK